MEIQNAHTPSNTGREMKAILIPVVYVILTISMQYISAYPKGYKVDNFLSLYLEVPDYGSLPSGWRRHARYRLIVVNQRSEKLSRQLEVQHWFDVKSNSWGLSIHLLDIIGKVEVNGFHLLSSQVEYASRMFEKHPDTALEIHLKNPNLRTESHRWFDQKNPLWGFPTMIPLAKIHDKNEGFLVNDQLMIVAEVDVLQVVVTSEKSEETNPLSQQVESVSSVQDSVVEFRARNQHLKTACTNVLLSLTQTLCLTPQELSVGDLVEAEKALAYTKDTGLEVEWLVKKLNEVKEKKEAQSG
ncbi:unnamed protein product [Brassica napus]|uniref:(rape) hypothetical protein n=1 Tax=Brassica napus TaxID=3708 RepID=A0A816QC38_BRANA|nr:unnamed protein product [Brassica napus]